jgi:hypothetical protein
VADATEIIMDHVFAGINNPGWRYPAVGRPDSSGSILNSVDAEGSKPGQACLVEHLGFLWRFK